MLRIKFCVLCLLLCFSVSFASSERRKPGSASPIEHKDPGLAQSLIARYGSTSAELEQGWHILLSLGYKMEDRFFMKPEHMVILKPGFDPFHSYFAEAPNAEPRNILPAWDLFMSQKKRFSANRKFESDLADLSAEVLSQYANAFQKKIAHSFFEKEDSSFKKRSAYFLVLMADLDKILDSEPELAWGAWLSGQTDQNSHLSSVFHSSRHLIGTVYLPRWKTLFKYAAACLTSHQKFDEQIFQARMQNMNPDLRSSGNSSKQSEQEKEIIDEIYQKYKDADLGSD